MSEKPISLTHSILEISDTGAVAFLILLHSKPEGKTVSKSEVTETFRLGRTAFYRARKFLLDQNLITEIKKNTQDGHFDGIKYLLVSHGTGCPKSTRGDLPHDENQQAVQNNSSFKNKSSRLNKSNNNVGETKFKKFNSYPDEFERIWKSFSPTLGQPGSKQEAFKQFEKLDMGPDDVAWLVGKIKIEIKRKAAVRAAGEFDPQFPHVCRIFKYRSWESWPDEEPETEIIL